MFYGEVPNVNMYWNLFWRSPATVLVFLSKILIHSMHKTEPDRKKKL